jgi:beta-phosphoglucomutase
VIGAVAFDLNGTLSDDEPILSEIWQRIAAENGRPLSGEEYFERLAGLADPEIAARWLGVEGDALETVMAERARLYRERVADGSSVGPDVRAAVRFAAARVPVAVVSGAVRADIDLVLGAAGLDAAVSVVVAAEDVRAGKPDPEGYLRALERLGGDLVPSDVLVLEDSEPGVLAAKAAGMRCVAVLGTAAPARLAAADEVVERVDVPLLGRLLG